MLVSEFWSVNLARPVKAVLPSKRPFAALARFLLLHGLVLSALHLAIAWCWVLAHQPNEFSALSLLIALYASPFLVLLAAPFHASIHRRASSDHKHLVALAVTCSWIGVFNLIYLL